MTVLFVVVPVALVLVGAAIAAYAGAARRGQFDDLVTPALRVLHDDPPAREAPAEECASPASEVSSRRAPIV